MNGVSVAVSRDAEGAWNPALHPRVPKGGPGGGEFGPGGKGPTPTNAAPVQSGQSGPQVKSLQERLARLGYPVQVDGKFGKQTSEAVRRFQKEHQDANGKPLKVDGLVGPLTTGALRMKTPVKHSDHAKQTQRKTTQTRQRKLQTGQMQHPHAAAVPDLVTIPEVDLIASGTWDLSSGRQTFTPDDLVQAIEAAQCPAVGAPKIKLGHTDPRFNEGDGQPAIGKVINLRVNDTGTKLIGDMIDMPGWLAAISAAAYPHRSVEGTYGFTCQIGHVHPFVLTGLALLGVASPGIGALNDLPDIATLYGVQAAQDAADAIARSWQFSSDNLTEGPELALTEEDVRRAYYATSTDPNWWITELQMAPTQLIVTDGSKIYRVPFQVTGSDSITFEGAVEVPSYAELAAVRSGPVVTYASAGESRSVADDVEPEYQDHLEAAASGDGPPKPYGNVKYADPKNGKYPIDTAEHAKAAWSYINQEKNAAKYPLNGVSLDSVKSAIMAACKHFGIDTKAAAADPPTLSGDNKTGNVNNASMTHGAHDGAHSHPHAANNTQGSDETHKHSHTHKGDGDHGHAHASAAGNGREGDSDVDLTDEQKASLRASLGLSEDEELTPELILTASAKLREDANAKVAAGKRTVPPGVIQVEQEVWDNLNRKVDAAAKFQAKVQRNERDDVIGKAIRDGKFSAARQTHWVRLWDSDPEGTRDVIATLQKNVVPVDDIGSGGGTLDDDAFEGEFAALYPPGTFVARGH